MKNEQKAVDRLKNSKSKVSSHYVIKRNGQIILLVPTLYIAWHAGVSSWKENKFLNKSSIGIEITNPGHQYGYRNFTKKQILSYADKNNISYVFDLSNNDNKIASHISTYTVRTVHTYIHTCSDSI